MTPQDITPAQAAQVVALGAVLLGTLLAGLMAYGYWFYRAARGVPFNIAKGPLATIGLIDCALVIAIMLTAVKSLAMFAHQGVVPEEAQMVSLHSKPVSYSQETDAFPIEQSAAPEEADADSPLEEKPADPETQSRWGKLTVRQVVLSSIGSAIQLLTVVIVIVFIRIRTGCGWDKLGLSWRRFSPDVGTGIWLLFLTIPVLLVFSGVVNAMSGVEYKHPVIEIMKQFPWAFGLVAWMAVIVAPIAEEFFFRTLLIGWFESIHFGKSPEAFFLGLQEPTRSAGEDAGGSSHAEPKSTTLESKQLSDRSSLALSGAATAKENPNVWDIDQANVGVENQTFVSPWWPALVSGTLFGLAHAEYGISWIPLVFFGIVLGRIYQLRQSLVTCITIHMLFNAINLLNLWLSIGIDLHSKG